MSAPITVTDDTFDDVVLASEHPVLVDFWADWCGPCKMIAPVLEQIAAEYEGRLTVAKLDIDANPKTPVRYSVIGAPTLNLYKNGDVVERIVGAKPKRHLIAAIEPHL